MQHDELADPSHYERHTASAKTPAQWRGFLLCVIKHLG